MLGWATSSFRTMERARGPADILVVSKLARVLRLNRQGWQSQRIHSNESFRYLCALKSPERAWPSKFSARADRPHNLPNSPLSLSDPTSCYVIVLRSFPTHRLPVKRAAFFVGNTWFVPMHYRMTLDGNFLCRYVTLTLSPYDKQVFSPKKKAP